MEFFEKVVGAAASVGIGFGVTHIDADFDQLHILPPSIEDWVGPTHPTRFIRCFVESLDLMDLGIEVRDFGTAGRPPFAPALLLRLWLYGYFKKIRSSRKEWRKNKMNNLRFLNLISMLLSVPCLTVPLSKAFAGSWIP